METVPLDRNIRNRLTRFIHLGLEQPIYFPGCWSSHNYFHIEKLKAIDEIFQKDKNNTKVVDIIVKSYKDGSYTQYETIAFALCKCLLLGGPQVKEACYKSVNEVCQTSEELMLFTKYAWTFKSGSGQGWCKSIRTWYNSKDPIELAREFTRVKARCGRSHSVLLQKSHIKIVPGDVVRDAVIKYAIFGLKRAKQLMENIEGAKDVFDYIQRVEDLRHCEDPTAASAMIIQYKFNLDHVPTHLLTSQEVWDAILPQMSLSDILHNLHRLHNLGFLTPDSTTVTILISLFENKDMIKKSNLTPLAVYITICNYKKRSVPMKFEKLKVAAEKTARRRSKQQLDSKTGLWEWTITKCHPKDAKYWADLVQMKNLVVSMRAGIDQPPNETVLVALNKLFDQTWLLTPATGMRYMITMDMRHHMFKGRHFCKSYSLKSDKKKAKTGSTTASTGGGDADNAEKKSKKRIFAECFYNKNVTPGHAAIVLALQILKREKNAMLAVFTEEGIQILNIERNFTNIEEAEYIFRNANNGRVQLDAPIHWAIKTKTKIDVFINMVDRTTRLMELDRDARGGRGPGGRYGPPPPSQDSLQDHCPVRALEKYRKECKQPNSKLIVMSLASHRIATNDGSYSGVLDTVGIDEYLPKVLDEFVKGQFY